MTTATLNKIETELTTFVGEKFNPSHDRLGRFASGPGGGGELLSGSHRVAQEWESKHRSDAVESVAVIKNGKIVGEDISTSEPGTLSENMFSLPVESRGQEEGSIITHNHPNGGSFSIADLSLLGSARAAEGRVVTRDKTYRILPPKGKRTLEGLDETTSQVSRKLAADPKMQREFLKKPFNEAMFERNVLIANTVLTKSRFQHIIEEPTAHKTLSDLDSDELWAQLKIDTLKRMGPIFGVILLAGADAVSTGLKFNVEAYKAEPPTELQQILLKEVLPTYMDEWWAQIEATSRQQIRTAVATMTKEGYDTSYVVTQLEQVFSPQRAQLVAVTEVTRLFAKGAQAAYKADGIKRVTWRSVRDPWVCSICGDHNNKEFDIETVEPPAHPRCRCFLSPVVVVKGA